MNYREEELLSLIHIYLMMTSFSNGLTAGFGEVISKKETDVLKRSFSNFEYLYMMVLFWVFACMMAVSYTHLCRFNFGVYYKNIRYKTNMDRLFVCYVVSNISYYFKCFFMDVYSGCTYDSYVYGNVCRVYNDFKIMEMASGLNVASGIVYRNVPILSCLCYDALSRVYYTFYIKRKRFSHFLFDWQIFGRRSWGKCSISARLAIPLKC